VIQKTYNTQDVLGKPKQAREVRSGVTTGTGTNPAIPRGGRTSRAASVSGGSHVDRASDSRSLSGRCVHRSGQPSLVGPGPGPLGGGWVGSGGEGAQSGHEGDVGPLSGGLGAEPPRDLKHVTRRAEMSSRSSLRNNQYKFDYEWADLEIERAAHCGNIWQTLTHSNCGAIVAFPTRCDSRACKRCASFRGARLRSRYQQPLMDIKALSMLTFTIKNVMTLAELPEALETLMKGWERIRRRKVWNKEARGVWSLEITWSKTNGFHPHLHVVGHIPWIDLDELHVVWGKLTGAKARPHIERARSTPDKLALIKESMKYVCKSWELDPEPKRGVLAILKKRNAVHPFGGLKRVPDPEREKCHCPRCGVKFKYNEWEREEHDSLKALRRHPLWADIYWEWEWGSKPNFDP